MGQDLCLEKFVEASTPKFGEWAERWGSREPRTIKTFDRLRLKIVAERTRRVLPSVRGEARPPAFGPLSKFGGGRFYKFMSNDLTKTKQVHNEVGT